MRSDIITLDQGSGGKASHRFIQQLFVRYFDNPILSRLDDAALLNITGPIAMSTDSYTVDPLFFPGGSIGSLAVHGTINDVAMLGASPSYLSCAFIIEEGLQGEILEQIVADMAAALEGSGVLIVTGDTKVVPKGAVDKLFINTTGIGSIIASPPPSGHNAKPGDAVLISGSVGDHGLTVLAQRQGLALTTSVQSDSAALHRMTMALIKEIGNIHVLRDPTRGGLATTLNEIAMQSECVCTLEERSIPVSPDVAAGCSILGLDPLYLANEGKCICILPEEHAEKALSIMRKFPAGQQAVRIGSISAPTEVIKPGQVILQTPLGGKRLLSMLEGEQLPRIC